MDLKKRKNYYIFTNIFWWAGFILYGGMAVIGKESLGIPWNTFLILLVYGLGGGLLLGGLVSGILLFGGFFKRQSLFLKVVLCVFSPITVIIFWEAGIFSLVPYGIYNFFILRKIQKNQKITDEKKQKL